MRRRNHLRTTTQQQQRRRPDVVRALTDCSIATTEKPREDGVCFSGHYGGRVNRGLYVAIGSASLAGRIALGGVLCSLTQEPVVTTANCDDGYRCESCMVLLTGTNAWVLTAYPTTSGDCARHNALYWLSGNGSSGGVSEACSSCYNARAEYGGCNCCRCEAVASPGPRWRTSRHQSQSQLNTTAGG